MDLCLKENDLSIREQTILIIFLDHCFNSLVSLTCSEIHQWMFRFFQELDVIRAQVQKIVGLTIWTNLTPVSSLSSETRAFVMPV